MAAREGLPRWVDAAAAGLLLAVSAPLLLVAAASIKLDSAGPVFFRQERVGRGGRIFTLIKLRTMTAGGRGGTTVTAGDDARITRVGRLLRRSKVDELPELWNIVCGEMALVGPRPEVPAWVELDDPLCQAVLEARPGLTDPVTLRLRNEESLLEAVEGDRELFYREVLRPWKLRGYAAYLESRSPWSDLRVLLATLLAVVRPASAPPPTLEELRR